MLDDNFELYSPGVYIIHLQSCHWLHWMYVSQDPNYCSQEKIFHDLGVSLPSPACNLTCVNVIVLCLTDSMTLHRSEPGAFVLKNAFEGYNCSVFAYGQVHVDISCGVPGAMQALRATYTFGLIFRGRWLPIELLV